MLSKQSGVLAMLYGLAACITVLLSAQPAQAYPWMIRHHYAACSTCHYDPSGAGPITAYGRAVGDSVIRMGGEDEQSSADLPESAKFLFGVVPTPKWLELGGDIRTMLLSSKQRGVPLTSRLVWMQLDGEATISASGFVASGTLGYAPEGALGAAVTRGTQGNVVSRQHWLGYQLPIAELQLRAGRMNLPFGIRSVEHTLWARKLTRTNINDEQQYGASVYFGSDWLRGEVMGIVGNLQLRPDRYRERGYSAYLEAQVAGGLALGASSLITHRSLDTVTLTETWRQVHGVFGRWATPYQPLVLLTEWDYVFESSRDSFHKRGLVSYVQADWEPIQGIHVLATGEANKVGMRERHWSYSGWLSYAWFCAPHADVRLDGIYQSLGSAGGRLGSFTVLLQGHMYL
jgi:hypothetical protein